MSGEAGMTSVPSTFVDMVESMRKEQKAYFETRDYLHLSNSKRLEAEVDRQITWIRKHPGQARRPTPEQGELFA